MKTINQEAFERRAYRLREAADMLSISRPYLYRLNALGLLKISKLCGRSVIWADELERFIAQQRIAA